MTLERHETETLERRLLTLPDEVYRARQAHVAAKERALAAERAYRRRKSEMYQQYAKSERTHYRIEHCVSSEPSICEAKRALDAAELEVYRAWSEAERLRDMLGVALTLVRDARPLESPGGIGR
jgi:hypothetical protein